MYHTFIISWLLGSVGFVGVCFLCSEPQSFMPPLPPAPFSRALCMCGSVLLWNYAEKKSLFLTFLTIVRNSLGEVGVAVDGSAEVSGGYQEGWQVWFPWAEEDKDWTEIKGQSQTGLVMLLPYYVPDVNSAEHSWWAAIGLRLPGARFHFLFYWY